MTEHEVFETRLRTALARHVANAPTGFDALEFARSVAAAEPRRRGRAHAIAAALVAWPGDRRRWSSVLVPPAGRSAAFRMAWLVAVTGLLVAATASAVFVGSELLRRTDELAVVPAPVVPPTVVSSPSAAPASTATLPPLVLKPVGEPTVSDTALGTITWRVYQPAGHDFSSAIGTAHGVVKNGESELLWLEPDGSWARTPLPEEAWGLAPVGDGLITWGKGKVRPISWDGSRWVVGDALGVPPIPYAIVWVAAGPRGVIIVSCQRDNCRGSTDGVAFATDGRHFVATATPPGGGDVIGPVLATEDGFVALVAAQVTAWPTSSLVEPRVWFSADGLAWEPASSASPFGEGARIRSVAGRAGQFVAVGNIGSLNGSWAAWGSDDGRTWERLADLELEQREWCTEMEEAVDNCTLRVTAGGAGWVITTGNDSFWASADGRTWEPLGGPAIYEWGLPGIAVGGNTIVATGLLDPWGYVVAVGTIER